LLGNAKGLSFQFLPLRKKMNLASEREVHATILAVFAAKSSKKISRFESINSCIKNC